MQINQLIYAVKLAEECSYIKASAKLFISQPSLSKQISNLEKELNTTLFIRDRTSIKLTYTGEVFIARAKKILDSLDELTKEIADIEENFAGTLSIGCLTNTGIFVLPKIIPIFKELYPHVNIKLYEESTSKLLELLQEGKTDLTILTLPIDIQKLSFVSLFEENIVLAVSKNHKLAKSNFINIQDLKDEEFICLKRGNGFRKLTNDICYENGFKPNVVFESHNIHTILALIPSSNCVAFIPEMFAFDNLDICYVRFNSKISRTVGIAYKQDKYLSKVSRMFIDTACSVDFM